MKQKICELGEYNVRILHQTKLFLPLSSLVLDSVPEIK